jgi:hypothetical protein
MNSNDRPSVPIKTVRQIEIGPFSEVTPGCHREFYGCEIHPSWFRDLRGKRVRIVLEVEE